MNVLLRLIHVAVRIVSIVDSSWRHCCCRHENDRCSWKTDRETNRQTDGCNRLCCSTSHSSN